MRRPHSSTLGRARCQITSKLKRFHLLCGVSSGSEEGPTFVWRKEVTDFTDGVDELIEGPCANASEMGLPLREGHLDGVEIGAIGLSP